MYCTIWNKGLLIVTNTMFTEEHKQNLKVLAVILRGIKSCPTTDNGNMAFLFFKYTFLLILSLLDLTRFVVITRSK